MKLWQLIRSHLGPYRRILLIVVVLQAIQTFAALTLPTINALLIDNGVLQGDNDYILTMGAVMIGFTMIQIVFTVGAVWFGARAAMGFGRDIRRDLFHTVTGYSAREVGEFGAPSLITRRVTYTRGKGSWTVTLMYGYRLSSRRRMLKRGRCSLMRLASRMSASASDPTTMVSRESTWHMSSRVLGVWSASLRK